MARLAKVDIDTFNEKQVEKMKKLDPKILKQQRALPPIQGRLSVRGVSVAAATNQYTQLPVLT